MLLLLLTALSGLTLHTTTAYSPREVYENDLVEQAAREAIAQVMGTISRPSKRPEPEVSYADGLLDLILRPDERMEQDLSELRFLVDLLSTQAKLDTTRGRGHLMVSRPEKAIRVDDGQTLVKPLTMRRRSCQFRLGGHCLTQHLDMAMRQKEYLMSPDSPGRKRRSLRSVLANQMTRNP